MAVTFTKTARSYDKSTGVSTITETSVVGTAVQVQGNPKEYDALGLGLGQAITLLFVPNTYGEEPEVGSRCTWQSAEHVARSVRTVKPDAVPILSFVIAAKETA